VSALVESREIERAVDEHNGAGLLMRQFDLKPRNVRPWRSPEWLSFFQDGGGNS
jgi:hypothetical protein